MRAFIIYHDDIRYFHDRYKYNCDHNLNPELDI